MKHTEAEQEEFMRSVWSVIPCSYLPPRQRESTGRVHKSTAVYSPAGCLGFLELLDKGINISLGPNIFPASPRKICEPAAYLDGEQKGRERF